MSRIFGPVRQMAFVVDDIERAMHYWLDVMGVGPFFHLEDLVTPNATYLGKPWNSRLSIAFAQSGAMQIELLQPLNDEPSLLTDFLNAGRTGLQHVAYWTTTFEADVERYQQLGYRIVQTGGMSGPNNGNVFLEGDADPATSIAIEISDIGGSKGQLFRSIAEAAEQWDGSDPIRKLAPR